MPLWQFTIGAVTVTAIYYYNRCYAIIMWYGIWLSAYIIIFNCLEAVVSFFAYYINHRTKPEWHVVLISVKYKII